MGVKGLQAFLDKCLPDACYLVYISQLVDDHRMRTGRNARIVVDAQSCYHLWYQDSARFLGCEVEELIMRLQTFVESFEKLNVELVFFFGGLKLDKNIKKSQKKYRKIIEHVHRDIDTLTCWGSLQTEKFKWILSSPGLTTAYILKYVLGCEVHLAIDECRKEIIKYVHEQQCCAIFSQNTDFVVSQVNAFVLTGRCFLMQNMTTLLYDRVQLAGRLGILVEELPLLAILAGNDLIPFDQYESFHRRILGRKEEECEIMIWDLIPAIASYINELPKSVDIELTLAWLAVELSNGDPSIEEVLKESYFSYFVSQNPAVAPATDKWSEILLAASNRCWDATLPILAYSVLSEQKFEGDISFENLRGDLSKMAHICYQPSSTVLRPLRLRLYGILLVEKDVDDPSTPVTVREWCNENITSYEKPVLVEPVKPEVHHPGLMALWSNYDILNEIRWTLFLKTISPTLEVAQWQSFDHGLLFTTLSVYHLYEIKYLNEYELIAVLATIATCPLYAGKVPFIQHGRLYIRAVDISTTLIRTFELVLTILAACGYPVEMSQNNAFLKFENKIFQNKYADVMNRNVMDIWTLCENNQDCFELFKRMRELIGTTEDDQSSAEVGEVRM